MTVAIATFQTVATADPTDGNSKANVDEPRPTPETAAKLLWDKALKSRTVGDYGGAIKLLKEAYDISHKPGLLFALGKAYLTIDKPVDAVDAFERYLEAGKNQIPPGQRVETEAALKKLRERVGFVELRVSPPGAAMSLDGVALGATAQVHKVRATAGRHTVEASLPGYAPTTLPIEVTGGKETAIEINLDALPVVKGALQIECPVPDVVVTANEAAIGTTPFTAPALLTAGDYKVRFDRAGYVDDVYAVSVSAERPASVKCGMKLLAPLPDELKSRVRIIGTSGDVQMQVDGEVVPPELDLPSGRHQVRVNRPGYRTWERDVNLRAGTTVDLKPEMSPDGSRPSQAMIHHGVTQRTWAFVLGAAGLALGGGALGLWVWNEKRNSDDLRKLGSEFNDANERVSNATTPAELDAAVADKDDKKRRWSELNNSIRLVDGIEIGMLIGAGTVLCAGTLMWLTGGESSSTERVAVVPHKGGASLAWSGVF